MENKIYTWKLYPGSNGVIELFNLHPEPNTLDEGTQLLPMSGYTTLRTYRQNQGILLNDHFRRLEETAELAGKPLKIDYRQVRMVLRQVIEKFPSKEKRIRMMIDLEQEPGTIYFLIEELLIPKAEDYRFGVKVVTRKMQRQNPKAKLTNFIDQASKIKQDIHPGINEVLMVSEDGKVLEGLSSNFFGVINGVIRTPDEGILYGITRSMVIQVIGTLGFPLQMEAISKNELQYLDECFITSASRSILPVIQIDEQVVGTGSPGKVTLAILEEYLQDLNSHLEPI